MFLFSIFYYQLTCFLKYSKCHSPTPVLWSCVFNVFHYQNKFDSDHFNFDLKNSLWPVPVLYPILCQILFCMIHRMKIYNELVMALANILFSVYAGLLFKSNLISRKRCQQHTCHDKGSCVAINYRKLQMGVYACFTASPLISECDT